jgi:CofD-related protein of GAK system
MDNPHSFDPDESRPKPEVPATLAVTRIIRLPDPIKTTLYARNPDLVPEFCFFSGGSALRDLSRELVLYTHNSIHIITPFDSGGSSAELRRAFHMPAVGDVRNRLMALADRTIHGFPDIYSLFAYRFSRNEAQSGPRAELGAMIDGRHELVRVIPDPMRKIIRHHLRLFRERKPRDFDLRGASVGNLILTSGYLENERHLDPVIYIFSHLVRVRGVVRPATNQDLHLVAHLENGDVRVGQHNITGKEVPGIASAIRRLFISKDAHAPKPFEQPIRNKMRKLIAKADVICYPMGSFYTSVVANLLLKGMGEAVARNDCPKIFVPSTGTDPETRGMSLNDQVKALLYYIDGSAGRSLDVKERLHYVLTDTEPAHYPGGLDRKELNGMGIRIIEAPLVSQESAPHIDPTLLARILVSLA